jgi:hypothetical protein
MRKSKIFMAFGKGVDSAKETVINRYIGVGSVGIVAINPTKEELEKLYNTTLDSEPEYFGKSNNNGKEVETARVAFLVKPDPVATGLDITPISVAFFLNKDYRYNNDGTKIEVIDEYGNSGWATKEQLQNHSRLLSKDGKPLKISTNYRPAYVGEIRLTSFIKAYLGVPDAFEYVDNTWQLRADAELGIARFENVENMFKGDFSEVKEIIAYQPENKVKVLFGVKKDDDGRMKQAFYRDMFLRNKTTNYSKLDADVKDRKNNGAYPTTDFEVCDLKIYDVKATNLAEAPAQQQAPANPWFQQ